MTTISVEQCPSTPAERAGPPRIAPLVADQPAMREWAAELVERARSEGVELTGETVC